VETTTRHAFAAPRRLGSIPARVFRRRMPGTGPFDPCPTFPPGPRPPFPSKWRAAPEAPPSELPSSESPSQTSPRGGRVGERVRPTVARVDLGALKANFRAIAEHLRQGRPAGTPGVIAVVKANAYGHGATQVARALEDAGADLLACADIEEGAALRAAGVRAEILVFGALSVSDLDGLFDGRLTPTISSPGAARAVQAAAARYKARLRYHLKIDTGMNRLGFRFDNLGRTLPELLRSGNLELDAVFTHFATADDPESPLFDEQRRRFEQALAAVEALGARPRYRHA